MAALRKSQSNLRLVGRALSAVSPPLSAGPRSAPGLRRRVPPADTVAIDGTGRLEGRHWWLLLAGLGRAGGRNGSARGRTSSLPAASAWPAGAVLSAASAVSFPLKAEFHFDPRIDAKLGRTRRPARRSSPADRAPIATVDAGAAPVRRLRRRSRALRLPGCRQPPTRSPASTRASPRAGSEASSSWWCWSAATDGGRSRQTLRRRFESNTGLARARVAEVGALPGLDGHRRSAHAGGGSARDRTFVHAARAVRPTKR